MVGCRHTLIRYKKIKFFQKSTWHNSADMLVYLHIRSLGKQYNTQRPNKQICIEFDFRLLNTVNDKAFYNKFYKNSGVFK